MHGVAGRIGLTGLGLGLLAGGLITACAATRTGPAHDLSQAEDLARGGRLYDKWYAEAGLDAPTQSHPAYPADAKYADDAKSNWRCKECHGWDYMGKHGAYASGKHASGIGGIRGSVGADTAAIEAVLRGETHGFGARLGDEEIRQLALFVARGQVDMDAAIDRATKKARGDAGRGAAYYATICAGCHGDDGREPDMPVLGDVARSNPWETLHKILNGQPASSMPALRALDSQISRDILAHTQTLPGE